jgi:hypothetical protein
MNLRLLSRTPFAASLVVAALVAAPGCGGKSEGIVSGKVTFPTPDKPLPGGQMILHPVGGEATAAPAVPINPDGTFSVGGIPPGDYKVTFESLGVQNPMMDMPGNLTPEIKAKMNEQGGAGNYPTGGGAAPAEVNIPPKFTVLESTPFTWTIKKGKNEPKEFNLTAE